MSLKFHVALDRDEDGVWVVECPAIPGCVSQGATREDAYANIEDAIRLCLEVRAERGLPPPKADGAKEWFCFISNMCELLV